MGLVLQLQGRHDEAETVLLEAVEIDPGYWNSFDALSGFYRKHSDNQDKAKLAVKYALKVIELVPDSASAYNNLGTAYDGVEQFDAAKMAWDRALELKPTRTAYTNRGLSYYYDHHFETAAEMQAKAIELAPSDHRVWGRFAEAVRFVTGRQDESVKAFREAIRLAEPMLDINERDWKTRGLLGVYYAHDGRSESAIQLSEKALTLSKRGPEALLYAALAYQIIGQSNTALDLLEEAVEKDAAYRRYVALEPDFLQLKSDQRFTSLIVEPDN
jgi:serine/threonine-protein kinase